MIAIGWRCILYNIIKTAELVGLYARIITISFRKSKTALAELLGIKQTILNDDRRIQALVLDFYKMLKILKLTWVRLENPTYHAQECVVLS